MTAPGLTGAPSLAASADAPAMGAPTAGPPQRLVTRIVLEFMIDVLAMATRAHGGDIKAMVVFMAIQHANIEGVAVDPERAAGADLDDDLRRPITTHALAQSVSLPPETCRRYVQRLLAAGYCRRLDDRGLIVPAAVMAHAPFAGAIDSTLAAFVRMLTALRAVDFDVLAAAAAHHRLADPAVTLPPEAMRFALWAIMNGYVMRVLLDGIENHERDFVRGLIFVTVMAINVQSITNDVGEAWRYADADTSPPDDMRAPASVQAVAGRLGIPYETTRQHLIRMTDIGRAQRRPGGFIIPESVNRDPRYVRMGLNLYLRLLRAVNQLDRLGFNVAGTVTG